MKTVTINNPKLSDILEVAFKYAESKQYKLRVPCFSYSTIIKEYEEAYTKLTFTGKKKINKILRRLDKNMNIKSLNILLHNFNKRLKTTSLYFEKSSKEQEIDSLRKTWRDLQKKTEEARVAFKEAKKGFYHV
jgi:hypothetical protein